MLEDSCTETMQEGTEDEHMGTDSVQEDKGSVQEGSEKKHMGTGTVPEGTDSVQEATSSEDEFLCKACDPIPVFSYHWFDTRQNSRPLPSRRCKCFGCYFCQAPRRLFCLNCHLTVPRVSTGTMIVCYCDCDGCGDYDYEISIDDESSSDDYVGR